MTRSKYDAVAGTILVRGVDAATAAGAGATKIANVKKFGKFPGVKPGTMDITREDALNDDGTPDMGKQKAMTKGEPTPADLVLGVDENVIDDVYTQEYVEQYFEIRFPSGRKIPFFGAIGEIMPEGPQDGEVIYSVTIESLMVSKPVKKGP